MTHLCFQFCNTLENFCSGRDPPPDPVAGFPGEKNGRNENREERRNEKEKKGKNEKKIGYGRVGRS